MSLTELILIIGLVVIALECWLICARLRHIRHIAESIGDYIVQYMTIHKGLQAENVHDIDGRVKTIFK